ncbi:ATP-binding protein [Streptomyces sp. 24-1644]|uniref:ATP-binding protein n=1 Tax=Streptomyces sp. 24-1644 TaxID=3457315 RepID=UPI003FA7A425
MRTATGRWLHAGRGPSQCWRAGVSLDSVIAADALIVTTELVTNAVRHGGGLTLFRIAITDDAFHLSVGDASSRDACCPPEQPRQARGIRMAPRPTAGEHVGITALPDGKIINAVLRLA